MSSYQATPDDLDYPSKLQKAAEAAAAEAKAVQDDGSAEDGGVDGNGSQVWRMLGREDNRWEGITAEVDKPLQGKAVLACSRLVAGSLQTISCVLLLTNSRPHSPLALPHVAGSRRRRRRPFPRLRPPVPSGTVHTCVPIQAVPRGRPPDLQWAGSGGGRSMHAGHTASCTTGLSALQVQRLPFEAPTPEPFLPSRLASAPDRWTPSSSPSATCSSCESRLPHSTSSSQHRTSTWISPT